jgi:PAS domain-containing protein
MNDWKENVNFAITVCDEAGIITEMNPKACETFAKYGGKALIGKSLLDCHNEHSRGRIKEMLAGTPPNVYTIEKNGARKLIYQTPFYKDGKPAGLVELSLELPAQMPHHVRK